MPGADVVPVPAATVAVIRDGDDGLETWMMRRVRAMAFAPGAAVFPGGRVDPGDADTLAGWSGADADAFAARMGTDTRTARLIVMAAVRELFEETGVLLARPLPAEGLEEARVAIEQRDLSLAQFLNSGDRVLESDMLHPWQRWVTPPVETRRFDTWFFVAVLPEGSQARAVSSEADLAGWISIKDALRAQAAGEMRILPPTMSMLYGLDAAGSVAGALAAASSRSLAAVHPQFSRLADGSVQVKAGEEIFSFPAPAHPAR
jgi:8-oxo-dGTP pyrophosphatase MutT (NUDIX family)